MADKDLAYWERQGEARYENRDNQHARIPYPTQDIHTPEQEAAYFKGYEKSRLKEQMEKNRNQHGEVE